MINKMNCSDIKISSSSGGSDMGRLKTTWLGWDEEVSIKVTGHCGHRHSHVFSSMGTCIQTFWGESERGTEINQNEIYFR